MPPAITFEVDADMSAAALGAGWQADELERICAGRREIARLEAQEVRMLAGLLLEAEGSAAEDCVDAGDPAEVTRLHDLKVRSIATELAASLTCSLRAAEQRLGEAWTLVNELFDTLSALEAGEISRAHAHEIVAETAHLSSGRRVAEGELLPWAKELAVSPFRRKAKQVLETLETESLRKRHERALAKRRLTFSAGRDGMAHLDAYIGAADAARLQTGFENAAREARAAGDVRTVAQLEADFAVELLLNGQITIGKVADAEAAPSPVTVKERAPVTVDVLIPASTLAGHDGEPALIPSFGVIDPSRARELVATAPSLRRILTDPINGAILDFDRKSYRVPAQLKRVIRLRDGHCRAPGCSAPLSNCEIDHSNAYARGGTTALGNLAHLCANHHHLKHEAGWSLTHYLDGVLEWRAPSGRAYRTHPDVNVPAPPRERTDSWAPPEGEPEWSPFDLDEDDDADARVTVHADVAADADDHPDPDPDPAPDPA
ncbi:DUF222 domain-containing protein [Gryllotalpicola reticulitermitis]|uniref:DUF222 domain-containing protein n=1 Tax=Gryllotalpicola reticulitermitis TaxID=1184153 RepID=A0ABV8Q5G6_9MICO